MIDNLIEGRNLGALKLLLGPQKSSLGGGGLAPFPGFLCGSLRTRLEGEGGGLGGDICFQYPKVFLLVRE